MVPLKDIACEVLTATTPVSKGDDQAESEYVVGFTAHVAWVTRKLSVAAVLTDQAELQPSPDGWEANVEEPLLNPPTELQAPEAVVQAWAATLRTGVPVVGMALALKVYDTDATLPPESDKVNFRFVIWAA
jgi:hypothetical protein